MFEMHVNHELEQSKDSDNALITTGLYQIIELYSVKRDSLSNA
jgi:hypothetical protein